MTQLESVSDANWRDFTAHPVAVLMVAESDCPACKAWTEELAGGLESEEGWKDVRFGKILLDQDDAADFRKDNHEWLEVIDGVPFNVIYAGGEPRSSFYGGGIQRLWNRLARVAKEQG